MKKSKRVFARDLYDFDTYDCELQKPKLKDTGLAVSRNIGTQLDDAISAFKHNSAGYRMSTMGEDGNTKPKITQLEKRETLFQSNLPLLADLANQDVIDELYDGVVSLRKRLNVHVGKMALFGKFNSNSKSVALVLTDESAEQVKQERQKILSIIEQMSCGDLGECAWIDSTPHITLGRINYPMPRGQFNNMRDSVLGACPREEITLDRADYHFTT